MARKAAPKKELPVESTPIIERYRSRPWKEFVALYVPADKYPLMHKEYLK
jgi:hypothetical protein